MPYSSRALDEIKALAAEHGWAITRGRRHPAVLDLTRGLDEAAFSTTPAGRVNWVALGGYPELERDKVPQLRAYLTATRAESDIRGTAILAARVAVQRRADARLIQEATEALGRYDGISGTLTHMLAEAGTAIGAGQLAAVAELEATS